MIEVYSPTIRRKEMDAVLTALVEDRVGPGDQSRLLVQTAKEYLHFDYCLSLRSPATALYLAIKALDPEDGRGVIISALSPRYYVRVIEDLRLRPVFCDVAPSSPSASRETVAKALAGPDGAAPCCIVLHHTLGFVPDVAALAELEIPVIEDVSQSYGFSEGEEKEKAHGIFTILGLEEKDMLTAGGGALLYAMNRRDGALLRNFAGLPREYSLPDMNAAMALVQFREAGKNIIKRNEIAGIYTRSSQMTRHRRFIHRDNTVYNNYAFPLVLETGLKDVKTYARRKEIAVESAFEDTPAASGAADAQHCPESHSLSLRTVLFPLYPRLRSQEVERVSKLILTLP
ncbi:MAG: DegT/DnrJ/EryC1/StrS family aminotransferase [Treponema sp.]|jgi:dTDP-4-amino-4,6-dideoxygalactose transaminase|nr:DegT/DnrJ/EryC1/StrS family aminotransferase [Treponema sp.]